MINERLAAPVGGRRRPKVPAPSTRVLPLERLPPQPPCAARTGWAAGRPLLSISRQKRPSAAGRRVVADAGGPAVPPRFCAAGDTVYDAARADWRVPRPGVSFSKARGVAPKVIAADRGAKPVCIRLFPAKQGESYRIRVYFHAYLAGLCIHLRQDPAILTRTSPCFGSIQRCSQVGGLSASRQKKMEQSGRPISTSGTSGAARRSGGPPPTGGPPPARG